MQCESESFSALQTIKNDYLIAIIARIGDLRIGVIEVSSFFGPGQKACGSVPDEL